MAIAPPKDEAYLTSTIPNRIRIFKWLQALQQNRHVLFSHCPIRITLTDGKVKEGKKWQTTPFDIAREILKDLANNVLVAKVNGVLWDMNRPLEEDSALQFFTFDDDEGRDTFWHSSAHILGQSLEMEYGCKLCTGPCTTRGEGFYYDAFYGDLRLNDDNFKQIEAGALKAVAENQDFERIEVTPEQALRIFSDNEFKVAIINNLPADKTITVYRCGTLVDLCGGPHIPNTSFVKAIACLRASSAYWRGEIDRPRLQKVYGISFPDNKSLKEHLCRITPTSPFLGIGNCAFFQSIGNFFTRRGLFSSKDDDITLLESQVKDATDQKRAWIIEKLSWLHIHSRKQEKVRCEIDMLKTCIGNNRIIIREHQRLYHIAAGHYNLGEYVQSQQLVNQCLEIEPGYSAALFLEKAAKKKILIYGVINYGISILAGGVVVGCIAGSWANLKKTVFQIPVLLYTTIFPFCYDVFAPCILTWRKIFPN